MLSTARGLAAEKKRQGRQLERRDARVEKQQQQQLQVQKEQLAQMQRENKLLEQLSGVTGESHVLQQIQTARQQLAENGKPDIIRLLAEAVSQPPGGERRLPLDHVSLDFITSTVTNLLKDDSREIGRAHV